MRARSPLEKGCLRSVPCLPPSNVTGTSIFSERCRDSKSHGGPLPHSSKKSVCLNPFPSNCSRTLSQNTRGRGLVQDSLEHPVGGRPPVDPPEFRVSNFEFRYFPLAMEQTPRSHVFTGAEVSSMHKFILWLAAALLMTAVLTARMPRTAADDSIHGDWSARFNEGSACGCFNLEVERSSSWGHHNSWGNTHKISDFVGLDANIATAKDTPVHFELRRDAGIMSFDGRFRDGYGSGKFSFASSADYVSGTKQLGYSGLDQEQLFAFAIQDVSRQFVKDMADAGYKNLGTDDLMAFRIHGVSPEFARAMIELLPEKPDPDNLVAMRIHGVSPEFTKEINALLGKRFSVDDLVAMRIHGASPEFVKSMSALLGRKLGVEQLVAFRIHGVSPEFTEDIQKLVEKNISSDDLVAFRIHGVSPEFVRSMKEAGYVKISPDQLVAMRIHGVDAEFVKEVRAHGYKDPSIDDLIELRIHGLRHRESL